MSEEGEGGARRGEVGVRRGEVGVRRGEVGVRRVYGFLLVQASCSGLWAEGCLAYIPEHLIRA